jgi:hypothetical protein
MKQTAIFGVLLMLAASLNAVDYVNYSNTSNVTGISTAFDYSRNVMQTATGSAEAFGLLVLSAAFFCFYIIGSRYTQERALVYAAFMSTIICFLLVSANVLDGKWLAVCIIGLLGAVFLLNRVG